jgi:hypothetical protein
VGVLGKFLKHSPQGASTAVPFLISTHHQPENIMQLPEIKAFVQAHLTETEIKAFGYDLRRRESWETLADRCREYAAAAIDIATVATQTAYAVLVPLMWGLLWLACLTYHAGQAVAAWWHSAPAQATDTATMQVERMKIGGRDYVVTSIG